MTNANDLPGRASPGPPRRGGRWPGGSRNMPDLGAELAGIRKVLGDLSGVLEQMSPRVLDSRIVALDASGQAAGQHRLPYQCLAVTSFSAFPLTVAAAPLAGQAPGPGPGVTRLPPGGSRTINIRAYAWSVYGGAAGDLVNVETFSRPQPPAADSGLANIAAQAALVNYAQTPAPAAAAALATIAAPPTGLYEVQVFAALSGTTAAADLDNIRLRANLATVTQLPLAIAAPATPQPQGVRLNVRVITGNLQVQAVGNASAGTFYSVLLTATQIGP
jgi:hypothetical protein